MNFFFFISIPLFPVVLTPADLWYHSRFPRYRHLAVFCDGQMTVLQDVQELGILVVRFKYNTTIIMIQSFLIVIFNPWSLHWLRLKAHNAGEGQQTLSDKPISNSRLICKFAATSSSEHQSFVLVSEQGCHFVGLLGLDTLWWMYNYIFHTKVSQQSLKDSSSAVSKQLIPMQQLSSESTHLPRHPGTTDQ